MLALEDTGNALECRDEGAILRWETASEHQMGVFEIEASEDGVRWRSAGRVNPGAYRYRVRLAAPTAAFYRIRAVQLDGTAQYSAIRRGCPLPVAGLLVFPNPSEGRFRVQSESKIENIAVLDALVRLVYQAKVEDTQTDLSLALTPGVDTVMAGAGNRVLMTKLIIENN